MIGDGTLKLHLLVVRRLRQLRLGHQRAAVLAQLDPIGRQRRRGQRKPTERPKSAEKMKSVKILYAPGEGRNSQKSEPAGS
jgi:hypothetical protein